MLRICSCAHVAALVMVICAAAEAASAQTLSSYTLRSGRPQQLLLAPHRYAVVPASATTPADSTPADSASDESVLADFAAHPATLLSAAESVPASEDGAPPPPESGRLTPVGPAGKSIKGHSNLGLMDFGKRLRPHGGQIHVGAEFIMARPRFSEARAFTRVFVDPDDTDGVLNNVTEDIQFNFDYSSSFRTYLAYRFCDCCAEFRVTYSHLEAADAVTGVTTANDNTTLVVFEVIQQDGTVTATSDVSNDFVDLEYRRCIRLRDCKPCGKGGKGAGGFCPPWDLEYSVGLRIANLAYDYAYALDNSVNRIDARMDFWGAGPRIGLEGRRYFGHHHQFELYGNLGAALLIGDYEHSLARSTQVNPPPNQVIQVENVVMSNTRMIPVTEIEVGGRWQPTYWMELSAGYFFQAWWDLGMTESSVDLGFPVFRDDANIMAWDGFFLRGEMKF